MSEPATQQTSEPVIDTPINTSIGASFSVGTSPVVGEPVNRSEFKVLQGFVIGILVVVSITIITLVIQYFTATQQSYQNLVNQVTAQNTKIDFLIQSNSGKCR